MKHLSISDLQFLETQTSGAHTPKVSLYLPKKAQRSRGIQVVNMLKKAEQLMLKDHEEAVVREYMRPLWRATDSEINRLNTGSLAIFHSPDITGYMSLPFEVKEMAVVSDSFHIKPLLKWLQTPHRFFLLTLSMKKANLYRGSHTSLERVFSLHSEELEGPSIKEKATTRENKVSEIKKNLESRFLHHVAKELPHHVNTESAPLILAGVKELQSKFRSLVNYPHLWQHGLDGNFDRLAREKLHQLAIPLVKEAQQGSETHYLNDYELAQSAQKTCENLQEISRRIVTAEVDTLFVAEEEVLWGIFDPQTGNLRVHENQLDSKDDDILDDLAEWTLRKGGKVVVLPKNKMPQNKSVTAILRW